MAKAFLSLYSFRWFREEVGPRAGRNTSSSWTEVGDIEMMVGGQFIVQP